MLIRAHFPSAAAAAAVILAIAIASPPARAADEVLRGPPALRKENEVSAHFLLTGGIGDSWSGNKLGLDYGFQLGGRVPTWLDLQLNLQAGTCPRFSDTCASTGNAYEALAGGKWRFLTGSPFVLYAKAGGGLIFLFPSQARSAIGLAARGGGGLEYFLFEWLAFGVEAGLSYGHAFFDSSYTAGGTYAVLDLGAGVELLF